MIIVRRSGLMKFSLLVLLISGKASAQVDTVKVVVSGNTATGGKAISSFGYDPINDVAYVSSFGSPTTQGNIVMLKVDNVLGSGGQTTTPLISGGQFWLYLRGGDPDRSVGDPRQNGILLNPKPIGSRPAYSFAIINDSSNTAVANPTGANPLTVANRDPILTKRFYEYNLQGVSQVDPPVANPSPGDPYNDGRDVYTTRLTLSDMQTLAGTTEKSDSNARQFAWSSDGQSIYFTDSSSNFGGLYKMDASTWQTTRLSTDGVNTEPAVIYNSVTGADDIFVVGGGTTGNTGGIDKFSYSGGLTSSARSVVIPSDTIKSFFETTSNASILAMASDDEGNLYFGTSTQRGIYRVDTEGRIIKVMSGAERQAATTSNHALTLRMQPVGTTFDPDGPGGVDAYSITQVLFVDSTTDGILGAYVFKPGDFDRDNDVDAIDRSALLGALKRRGESSTDVNMLKYDLNGSATLTTTGTNPTTLSGIVDWKDVKVLQQFLEFENGDTNLDGLLDISDLNTMRDNYYTLGGPADKTWGDGDFASLDYLATTYAANAADANLVNLVDLRLIADTWLNVLGQANLTFADLDANGYAGQFRADVITAFGLVPEPASAVLLLTGLAFVARVYRVRRKVA